MRCSVAEVALIDSPAIPLAKLGEHDLASELRALLGDTPARRRAD
jgi:hypothetical protein